MKALAIILAAILLLFGLSFGGCAITLMFWNGPGDPGLVVGIVILVIVTALLIRNALLLFRWATRKPIESPPHPPRKDTRQR